MSDKIDRLFLERGCPHCGVIRAELSMEAAEKDDFRGTAGQKLFVLSSLSNEASGDLLGKYGLVGRKMPVLLVHDGETRTDTNHILGYLRVNGMTTSK